MVGRIGGLGGYEEDRMIDLEDGIGCMVDCLVDCVDVDDHIERYDVLSLYKSGVIPNSRLLTYQINVRSGVSSVTRGWGYKDTVTLNCIISTVHQLRVLWHTR